MFHFFHTQTLTCQKKEKCKKIFHCINLPKNGKAEKTQKKIINFSCQGSNNIDFIC